MKAKRLLAMILSVALVATSGNFTLEAHATTDGGDVPVIAAEDVSGSDAEAQEDIIGDGSDAPEDVETGLLEEPGTTAGDDVVVAWNNYFAVTESGKLREKDGVPIDTLSGTVDLPKEAKRIPAGIFSNNTKITGLTIPEDSMLAAIDEGAFKGSGIKSLALPDNVAELKKETFKNSRLQTISFQSTSKLTVIGEEAFFGSSLVKLTAPGSALRIEDAAFSNCSELNSIGLGNVEYIGMNAFKGCAKLATVGWNEKLKEVGDFAFSGIAITSLGATGNKFGAGITTWGSGVFENCTALTTVKLHDSMTTVPAGMFRGCAKIAAVELPGNCAVISREAFSGCSALKKITIPEKVGAIETAAFEDCSALTEVTINQRGSNTSRESDIILAEDAFNKAPQTLTLKGYDGTVQDYAQKKDYKFVTLFPAHTIKIKYNNSDYGKATLSKSKGVYAGEIIEVTVTPEADRRLRAYGFTYNDEPITTLKKEEGGSQVFTFVMPDEDVEVYVPFETTAASYSSLSPTFEQTDPQMTYTWDKKTGLTFDKTGMSCKLVVEGKKSSASYELSNWAFTYSSSKPKIATIDSDGVIYARGEGTAKITATLKQDTTKKVSFNVRVEAKADIDYDNITLDFADLNRAKHTTETIEGVPYHVIQYTQSNLSVSEQQFTVNMKATEKNATVNMSVHSEWKSANAELADVANTVSEDNTNVVCVKQGVVGETCVTVSVTNGETGTKKVTYYEESIIIRVIDVTPRLIQSALTVNSNCESGNGTAFDLLSVYGYEVQPGSLKVVQRVVKGSGLKKTIAWNPVDDVSIGQRDGSYYVELTREGRDLLRDKSSKTIPNAYIEGEYTYRTDAGAYTTEEFHTQIKSLVLTNKALKPTVKLSGKLNLFFNSDADVSQRGEVTITQSLKTLKVESYKLVSAANYQTPGSEAVDPLANNFVVDEKGVITRSANELMKDAKNKVVTSGYLQIKYAGYEPVFVKLTIPTQNSKPGYVISKTKATVNAYSTGYEMELQLLDKKTKKAISLADLHALSFDESAAGTTMGLFEPLDTEAAKASDKIILKIRNAQKGKAVVNVEMDTWNEPMKFTFNLSVNSSAPKAKLKKTTLTLNNLCVGKEESTDVTLSQTDVTILSMNDIRFMGNDALTSDAAKMNITYSAEDKKLTVSASGTVQAGSYKFSMTPHVRYTNQETEDLKAITVTVKVIDKSLTAALKPSSVTLNNRYVGRETAVTSYTIKNMPVGNSAVQMIASGVVIEGTNAAAQEARNFFDFTFETDATKLGVQQTQKVRKTGSYKYKISGLKTVVEGAEVEIQPFTITVKVIDKAAKLTVKASGTINPITGGSGIVYTLKASNTAAKITDLEVKELNKVNGKNNLVPLESFALGEIKRDDNGSIVSVKVVAKDSNSQLDAKVAYKLRIGVVLEGAAETDEPTWSGDLAVKPRQVLPKVKTDVTSATLYAGVAAGTPRRSQEIQITQTTEKAAVMNNVIVSGSNPENVRKALKVEFDPLTQKAKITLIRPDLLIANTEYSVKLEAMYENQMSNTKGTQFTIKVKVLN